MLANAEESDISQLNKNFNGELYMIATRQNYYITFVILSSLIVLVYLSVLFGCFLN